MSDIYSITRGQLEDVADAIRLKTGKSAKMTVAEMPNEINSIEPGGGGGLIYTSNCVAMSNGIVLPSTIGIAQQGILPSGYTQGQYLECDANTNIIFIPISGEIEYIAQMSFSNPIQGQVIGYELAANAYFGINVANKIAAEWSISDSTTFGIDDKDPSNLNTIHVIFKNNEKTTLTIEGSQFISKGYPGGFRDYSSYSSFCLNATNSGGASCVPMLLYQATFKNLQGVILMDLYPCTKDSDSTVGLYDIINNTFYSTPNATVHGF